MKSKLNLTIESSLKEELVTVAELTGGSISAFIENLVYLALHTDLFSTASSVDTERIQK